MSTLVDSNKRKADKTVDEKMESKKSKFTDSVGNNNDVVMSTQLSTDKIKEMMANAQKLIEERKSQLNFPPPGVILPTKEQVQQKIIDEKTRQLAAEVKERARVNELQARIQAKLASVGIPLTNLPSTASTHTAAPAPMILDDEGRTIDAKTGQTIQLQLHQPTLKANIRAKKREQFKLVHERPAEEQSDSKYFDQRLGFKLLSRTRKGFKFFEKGKFEKLGQRMRTKAQLERLQSEIAMAAKKTGIASVAKLAVIQPKKELILDEIPEVEWWDSSILKNETKESLESMDLNLEGISHLCEHPIQLKPPAEINKNVEITVMLTRKERKKLRRQNRSEIQKDIQEKIRLGLAPPPEPKVRLANLMRVLGTEAVQDPTKVEAHVRAQMAKRQKAHEDANNARALTKEQRREKKMSKIKEDTSLGVHVSIYRVYDLTNPARKFKVETNANQLFLTGLIAIHSNCNVIVVEGGPRQQKKYRKLLLHRIKWGEDTHKRSKDAQGVQDDSAVDKKENTCQLVWEGTVKNRAFEDLKFKLCPTEVFAREQFRKHGVEHYWDLAFNYSIIDSLPSEAF